MTLLLVGALFTVAGLTPAAARSRPVSPLANAHLSAIVLIERWVQATYRFLPVANPGPPVSDTGFPEQPDANGDYVRTIVEKDGTRTVITNHGGSPFNFDIDIRYSNRIRERVEARPSGEGEVNGVPTGVAYVHTFSTGDRVEYVQELQQDPGPDFGANFLYGVIWRGEVRLRSGDCLRFELRQTKAPSCFNFLTGAQIPEDECVEWFDLVEVEPGLIFEVPKPDRLHVELDCGTKGLLDLTFPILEPDVLDFERNATGTLVLGSQRLDLMLIPSTKAPGWALWETRGPNYAGTFQLRNDFSGNGVALRTAAKAPPTTARGRGQKLEFAARWNRRGIGTVVLPGGQTVAAGPFAGALDFQSLKWSGLGAKFGPAPGL